MAQNRVNLTFEKIKTSSVQLFRELLQQKTEAKGLNVFFAAFCVIDLFGVFPIVALPSAIISCGFYGLPLLLFVILLQIYTAVILGRCWLIAEKLDPDIVEKSRLPYAAVAELLYGKRMRLFVITLINVTVFGASVPNILVASQNLQLIGLRITSGNFEFSFCYWLIILGILMCPIMWLGSPKHMKTLASVSVVTCLSVSTLIWICILTDHSFKGNERFTGIELNSPDYITLLKVYGMIAFQFDVHPMLMTIEVDMEQKQRIGHAVCLGLFVTCFMSITTTLLAAYKYGMHTTPNVLEILPASNFLYLAIILVTIQLCLSNAVGSSALFQQIEEYFNIPKAFNIKRCIVRSAIMAVAVLIAEIVPRFDLVMGVIGGTLTGALIFILPPLFYRKILQLEELSRQNAVNTEYGTLMMANEDADDNLVLIRPNSYNKFSRKYISRHSMLTSIRNTIKSIITCQFLYNDSLLSKSVIVFGLIATCASTYFNLLNVSSFADFWSPCIHNLTYMFLAI